MKLIVNEIFYSLQGEGGRSGEPSIFIRLTQCNLSCSFCDTDFADGKTMTITELVEAIAVYPCRWIVWTGGEPTIQLRDEHLAVFKALGYKQAIETNGTRKVPSLIDYITCSPKINYETIKTRMEHVNEIRIPIAKGDVLPDVAVFPDADKYFVSPIFDADKINQSNVDYCVDLIKNNTQWTLSLQIHKLIHIE